MVESCILSLDSIINEGPRDHILQLMGKLMKYLRKKGTRETIDIPAGQGTTMQVLVSSDEAPHFALRKFIMEPHGGMPMHTNTVEHEQYIVRGAAIVVIGNEAFEVSAGDSIFIPEMVPHSYQAGKDGFEFICVVPNKKDTIELVK
jgi:quercetin dioxygenase-like cupin family protein